MKDLRKIWSIHVLLSHWKMFHLEMSHYRRKVVCKCQFNVGLFLFYLNIVCLWYLSILYYLWNWLVVKIISALFSVIKYLIHNCIDQKAIFLCVEHNVSVVMQIKYWWLCSVLNQSPFELGSCIKRLLRR